MKNLEMTSLRYCSIALIVVGILLPGSAGAAAQGLFSRSDDRSASEAGSTIRIDEGELTRLRGRSAARLADFPVGAIGAVTLELTRFHPFHADAVATLAGPDGSRSIPWPDRTYFRGRVAGEPGSVAFLVAGPDFARGFVETGGEVYRFGRDETGRHLTAALSDLAAEISMPPLCSGDVEPLEVPSLAANAANRQALAAPAVTGAAGEPFSPPLMIEPFIDTDQEFLALFASPADALDYLVDLAAAVSAVYDSAASLRIVFRGVRLWEGQDPWSATSTAGALSEVVNRWTKKEVGISRDFVHFVSGKSLGGGIAYRGVLCNPQYGYAVSAVFGTSSPSDPLSFWDVVVFAHETGHVLGSSHTHCYNPPVDQCYSGESGCYAGATSVPPDGGTIMSYCHTLPGGNANLQQAFHPTVAAVLRGGAEARWCESGFCIPAAAWCVSRPCGDGILDDGEECDDGNLEDGDCCSSSCTVDPDASVCDDGDACTAGDACSAGVCLATPLGEGDACDDGSLCTAATCQSGACVGAPDPATSCSVPTSPGKSRLLIKDQPIDAKDKVNWRWTHGQATSVADFGDPTSTDDFELCVYAGGDTSTILSSRAPAGGSCAGKPCWSGLSTGFKFKDRDGTPDGASRIKLKAGADGKAKANFLGKGDLLEIAPLGGVPLPVRAQLRNSAGACWEATYSTAKKNDAASFSAISD